MQRSVTASLVVGFLALISLIAAVILLIFHRPYQTFTHTVHGPSADTIPNTQGTDVPTSVTLTAWDPSNFTELYLGQGYPDVIATPVLATVIELPSDTVGPEFAGDVTYKSTTTYPLKQPAQGPGWCVISPTGAEIMSSFSNGFAQFLQWNLGVGNFQMISNKSSTQTILTNCPTPATKSQTVPYPQAVAVGTLGFRSMAVSPDGLRLYVAYSKAGTGTRNASVGDTPATADFPYVRSVGEVAVFTRATPKIQSWTYSCDLRLRNPFGAQILTFDTFTDPVRQVEVSGDEFGMLISTAMSADQTRQVAIRSSLGRTKAGHICIFQEPDRNQLYSVVVWTQGTEGEKRGFGQDMALGQSTLVAAVRDVGAKKAAVAVYQNQSGVFAHVQTLSRPHDNEDFGCALQLKADDSMLLVGAPRYATSDIPGPGGSVYVYRGNQAKGPFVQVFRFQDPLHGARAFGSYVKVDPLFLVACISQNQDNRQSRAPAKGDTPSTLLMCTIDNKNETLIYRDNHQLTQPLGNDNFLPDPSFGNAVSLAWDDNTPTTLRVVVSAPASYDPSSKFPASTVSIRLYELSVQ